MLETLEYCIFFLGINAPIKIQLKNKIWQNASGVHWSIVKNTGEVKEHIINLSINHLTSVDNGRNLNTVLAHEMVHAWQAEYKPWNKISHNKTFISMSAELSKFLKSEGVDIEEIYIRKYDKK